MTRARVPIARALLAGALLLTTNAGFAASFDCTKARSQVEKLICADPLLGRLDEALAANYGGMLTVDLGRSTQSVRAEQLRWLARRNRCNDVPCLVGAYKERVDETCDYGVASGVHPPCAMAEDVMARNVDAKPPGPAGCAITERELLGNWRRTSAAGFHDVMAFESDAGKRRFDSWLHDRPEFSGGTWSLENCVIHIGHPSDPLLDSRLHVLRLRKGVLSMTDQQKQAVVYVRMP